MATATLATVATPRCSYCRQPLLNQAAVRALHASEAAIAKEISQAAAAKATELATARIAEVREQAAKDAQAWQQKLAATKEREKASVARVREQVEKDADAKAERRVAGQMRSLKQSLEKTLEEKDQLKRRLEHVTAGDRGALHEDDVVRLLKDAFPDDRVERRGKGGDVLHEIFYRAGTERTSAGLIVYECKDTIYWNNGFIEEVKAAAEQHRTSHAVIVTKAFPAKQKDLVTRDGVVIVHPDRLVELVRVLRMGICEIHRAGLTAEGQAAKTLALYRYLTSEDFRQRFDAIIEIDRRLKNDLSDERKKHERLWERREACYNELAQNAAAIDGRIRSVIERRGSAKSNVVQLSAS